MNRVEWAESLNIGVADIDRQHQHLLAIRNRLAESCDAGAADPDGFHRLLSEMFEYTRTHFSAEEDFMRSIDYPDLAQQQLEHNMFIDAILDFSQDASRGGDAREDCVNFLTEWLLSHIAGSDMQIGLFTLLRSDAR